MNYRRNEDKWPVMDAMAYNNVINVSFGAESGAEPVLIAEAKAHMNITATDDDTYITALIKQSRKALEKYTGVGLISRTITAVLNNGKGNIEFPYGPVISFTSLADKEGTAIISADYKIYGTGFQWLEYPVSDFLTTVYVAGYTSATIPDDLKLDLLKLIAWNYRHRGDEDYDEEKAVQKFGKYHRRGTWLL